MPQATPPLVCTNCWKWAETGTRCSRCGGPLVPSGHQVVQAQPANLRHSLTPPASPPPPPPVTRQSMQPSSGAAPLPPPLEPGMVLPPGYAQSPGAHPPGAYPPGPGQIPGYPQMPPGYQPQGQTYPSGMPPAMPAPVQPQPRSAVTATDLAIGVGAGFAAAVLGAVIWAVIESVTHYRIGYVAIGIGLLVGGAVRVAVRSHGITPAIIAAGFALIGCIAGEELATAAYTSGQTGIGFFNVLANMNGSDIINAATDDPLAFAFWAISAFAAFRIAWQSPGRRRR